MKRILDNLFTAEEQRILIFLTFFALLGFILKFTLLTANTQADLPPLEKIQETYQLQYDLQIITKEELLTIPGIGEKRAGDILEFRDEHGFTRKADLLLVKGIGKATYNKIERYFIAFGVNDTTCLKETVTDPELSEKININTASAELLSTLKGIGPAKAERIITYRNDRGGFKSIDDLLNIKGIGVKTLDNIRDDICTGDKNE
ncbi:MAG: ComEA family DNA-binding protein [Candidatus Cloacimonetes bacterium]|nr:ComEA family DNA-binding protein [Candidatus Cloacimonadota bacterium]